MNESSAHESSVEETTASRESMESSVAAIRANERVLGVMLTLHGAVHLVGFLLAWDLYAPRGFSYDDIWPAAGTGPARVVGVVWLLAGAALAVIGARMASGRAVRVGLLVVALVVSVAVTLTAFPDSLPGSVISAVLLGAIVVIRYRRTSRST